MTPNGWSSVVTEKYVVILPMLWAVTTASDGPVVNTENGRIRGRTKQYNGVDVHQFLNIPYSAPPVGELRFRRPTPHANWYGIRDGTKYGPSCLQELLENDAWLLENKNMSEDCLQLNVFVPGTISRDKSKSVMVWIHGGGYVGGQGTAVDRSYLAIEGDVIVVAINYRLGIFGFLSTDDGASPGNYGLWDQLYSIQWVKRNIAKFGGDPENITLFGESAGGFSVGLLSISPRSKGLFKRAICQSGTMLSPEAVAKYSKRAIEKLGKLSKCTSVNNTELLSCLRKIPVETLQTIFQNNKLNVRPVIDGDLITDDPVKSLADKTCESYKMFTSIDFMAGINNAEGGLFIYKLYGLQKKYDFNASKGIPKRLLCDKMAPDIARENYQNNAGVAKTICAFYSPTGLKDDDLSNSIIKAFGDRMFVVPTIQTIKTHSDAQGRTTAQQAKKGSYLYVFTHQASYTWVEDRPPWLKGANHADELPFIFGLDAMFKPDKKKPLPERNLARQMMVYWTNFAKTGNPNLPRSGNIEWPVYTSQTKPYMNLTIPISLGTNLYPDRIELWTRTLPDIASRTSVATQAVGNLFRTFVHVCLSFLAIICFCLEPHWFI